VGNHSSACAGTSGIVCSMILFGLSLLSTSYSSNFLDRLTSHRQPKQKSFHLKVRKSECLAIHHVNDESTPMKLWWPSASSLKIIGQPVPCITQTLSLSQTSIGTRSKNPLDVEQADALWDHGREEIDIQKLRSSLRWRLKVVVIWREGLKKVKGFR
jgi:hypothetical protein